MTASGHSLADELVAIDSRLRQGGAGEAAWSADLAAKRQSGLHAFKAFLADRATTPYGETWASFEKLMARVADDYIAASRTRTELRQAVQRCDFVMIRIPSLVEEWAHLLSPEGVSLLRRALALVSVVESAGDDQQMGPVLDWLWERANEAGLDVKSEMRGVARISTEPTKSLLAQFQPADLGDWPAPPAEPKAKQVPKGRRKRPR